jgi:hypothetical protein
MDKFITDKLGGHPLNLDDLGFLQEGLAKGINQGFDFITSFDLVNAAPVVPLRGVYKTGAAPNDAITGGSAWVNPTFAAGAGEVMEVDELPATADRSLYDYYIEETPDPVLDPTPYLDASTPNVHLRRKLVAKDRIVEGVAGIVAVNDVIQRDGNDNSVHIMAQITKALFNNPDAIFRNKLFNKVLEYFPTSNYRNAINLIAEQRQEELWTTADVSLGAGFVNDPNYPVETRKIGNRVEWRGMAYQAGTQVSGVTIIQGYSAALRPLTDKSVPCGITNGGGRRGAVFFRTTGSVTLYLDNAGTDGRVNFDNIAYFV